MHISLEIQDSYYDKLMAFLKTLPKNAVEIETDDYPAISTDEAKKRVAEAVESYRNGTTETIPNDEMWQRIDKHTKSR